MGRFRNHFHHHWHVYVAALIGGLVFLSAGSLSGPEKTLIAGDSFFAVYLLAAAAAIYTMLQWAGVAETSAWLWFASLGGGLLLAAVLTVAISAVRTRRDAVAKQALGI